MRRRTFAPGVFDLSHLFQHLGYAAILLIVLLGNAGLPAPEESVLALGGYLAWQGRGVSICRS
jgi:membrane protein DedA with SNARE-associated domain